jgi:hypothetical protein
VWLCGRSGKIGVDQKKNPQQRCCGLIPAAEPSAMKKGGVVICRGMALCAHDVNELSGLPLLHLRCGRGSGYRPGTSAKRQIKRYLIACSSPEAAKPHGKPSDTQVSIRPISFFANRPAAHCSKPWPLHPRTIRHLARGAVTPLSSLMPLLCYLVNDRFYPYRL